MILNFEDLNIQQYTHEFTTAELVSLKRPINSDKIIVYDNQTLYNKITLDFSKVHFSMKQLTYKAPRNDTDNDSIFKYCYIEDKHLNKNVLPTGTTDTDITKTGTDITTAVNQLWDGVTTKFDFKITKPVNQLNRYQLINNCYNNSHNNDPYLQFNNYDENTLNFGSWLDLSLIEIVDPEIELSRLRIENANLNDNGKITIQNIGSTDEVLKLYYPITIDVSQISFPRVTPVVQMTIAQVQQKSYWPVSELTNQAFEATNAIEFSTTLKLGPISKKRRINWSDCVNNKFLIAETARSNNLDGMTSYENEIDLALEHKEITVNEGSTTTLRAASDNYLGYDQVTIKVKGDEDPDFAKKVIYPIPISAFGVYTINPVFCVPSTTRCSSITFTFADLSAAIAAGGVMGLLPSLFPASVTITENTNGPITYNPNTYPLPVSNSNCAYSSFTIDVNVPQPTLQENKIQTLIPSKDYREIEITPDIGYDAMEKITIQQWSIPLASNQIIQTYTTNGEHYLPSLQNSNMIGFDDTCKINIQVPTSTTNLTTQTFTTNGTKTPPSGYDGWSQISISVNTNTQTSTITNNGTYTPDSGYIGFSSVTVNVPQNTSNLISKTYTTNGWKYPPSGYDGFSSVYINVPQNTINLTTETFTTNGTKTPPSGYDGWSSININVPQKNLTSTTFITNGRKTPPSGYDGWNDIWVAVPEKSLTTETFTTNGSKTPPSGYDGWSSININIPTLKTLQYINFGNSFGEIHELDFNSDTLIFCNSSTTVTLTPMWSIILINTSNSSNTNYTSITIKAVSYTGDYSYNCPVTRNTFYRITQTAILDSYLTLYSSDETILISTDIRQTSEIIQTQKIILTNSICNLPSFNYINNN